MIVRRYEAATEEEALRKVHADLGVRAVILLTKHEPGENCEVVAAINPMEIVPDDDGPTADLGSMRSSRVPDDEAATSRLAPTPVARVRPPRSDASYPSSNPPSDRPSYPASSPDSVDEAPPPAPSQDRPQAGHESVGGPNFAPAQDAGPVDDSSWLMKVRRGLARDAYGGSQASPRETTTTPIAVDAVLRRLLDEHGVGEDLLESILTTAGTHAGTDDLCVVLVKAIQPHVKFANGIESAAQPAVIALIGPTGVGKTTTTAKLAAHHLLEKRQSVGLITTDITRVGGAEQLQAYANILDVPCIVAQTPGEVTEALRGYMACDLVLIDTAGRSAADRDGIADLGALMRAAGPHETHLLVSATTRRNDLWETARGFHELSPGRIAFTKLDETTSFGDILNFASHTQLPLSYFSTGQTVTDAIEVATPDRLARLLVSERRPFYC